MKQVININFQGRVVPIETTAFEILKNYTESLNKHFANEDGKEEIINDIESRIGELFQERITKGATCITDDDVNAIINSIGRPEDFEPTENASSSSSNTDASSNQQQYTNTTAATGHRRLYRDENNKVIGGVCAGLANYFNVDIVVVRIIFVVLFFTFGFGFIPYIIMWVAVPSTATTQIGGARRKLYRDADEKLIAGVCSGIGNYFGISPWIPRVLFLLPFLSFLAHNHWGGFWDFGDVVRFTFSPTSLIVYIILWIVIPEAITTSEKLAMKGEKVDINSIKNSVVEEMKTVGKKAESFGKEAGSMINEKAQMISGDVQNFSRRNRGGIGNVIAMLAKIFAYIIIGSICIGLVTGLIVLGVFSIGIFPLKDYILRGTWQNFYAWGTLVLFIAVPIIAVITWLIRMITKSKNNSKILRLTFGSLWALGWVCIIMLFATVSRDFKSSSRLDDQAVYLTNPKANKLIVSSSLPFTKKYYTRNWIHFEPFENLLDDDTAFVKNISVIIAKSLNDSFQVTTKKMSRGYDRQDANKNASLINFNATQKDSILLLDKGLAINKTDKFRNQFIVITVYVPVGKQIRVNSGIENNVHVRFGSRDDNWDNDYYDGNDDLRWEHDVDYIMKADGLYTLNGKKADGSNDRDNTKIKIKNGSIDIRSGNTSTHIGSDGIIVNDDDGDGNSSDKNNYRYNEYDKKTDSIKKVIDIKRQQKIDSINTEKEKLDKMKEKLENNNGGTEPLSSIVSPGINILMHIN